VALPDLPPFDPENFAERYVEVSVAAARAGAQMQAAELAHAISTLQIRMDVGFAAVNERLDRMDDRFDRMDDRFDRMDDRFDRMDARLDRIGDRLIRIEGILSRAFPENGHTPPGQGND